MMEEDRTLSTAMIAKFLNGYDMKKIKNDTTSNSPNGFSRERIALRECYLSGIGWQTCRHISARNICHLHIFSSLSPLSIFYCNVLSVGVALSYIFF